MAEDHSLNSAAKRIKADGSSEFDELCINAIRILAADTVHKANSGHPGAPMGLAPIAYILWAKCMQYAPHNPKWMNRDRFVLSNGHACALQYVMLHLTGYSLSLDDLKKFRQVGSITPGHPESHCTPGIEVTTGPLGQGIANAVGFAIAGKHLAAEFNRPNFTLLNNKVYCVLGDGCQMEGISGEACSLAGHLGLDNLVAIYDDNKISIDGETELAFTEDVEMRFKSYGWHTIRVSNADNNLEEIENALAEANGHDGKPVLILARTTIGFGLKDQGTEKVHGQPPSAAELEHAKKALGFNPSEFFTLPEAVVAHFASFRNRGIQLEQEWNDLFAGYQQQYPDLAAEFVRRVSDELPADWKSVLPKFSPTDKAQATRQLSSTVLNAIAPKLPELVGGSADLTPSTLTKLNCSFDFQKDTPLGRYLRFGVREHAMGAIGNGIAAYGGVIPFVSTFFNFLSYCWPAARLAALSRLRVIYIMTHDSIGLGEDGPTHQPIEMLPLARSCPDMITVRPADGNETVGAYIIAIEKKHGPTILCLSRQSLPQLEGSSVENVFHGAYTLIEEANPQMVLIATGSEVHIAVDAAKKLAAAGLRIRVVSAPCLELFDKQTVDYRRAVLPLGVPVVSVEASGIFGWRKYAHFHVGMTTFGESGALKDVLDKFGFTGDKIAAKVKTLLEAPQELLTSPLGIHYDF